MSYIKLKNSKNIIDQLCFLEKEHILYVTNSTQYLYVDDKKYMFSESFLKNSELNFVKQTKREVIKNGQNMHGNDLAIKSATTYFEYDRKKIKDTDNIIEIDINSAYWKTALMKGYISEKTYLKGFEYSKKCRLISLGCLAVKKKCYYFDGKNYIEKPEKMIHDPLKASYFFDISYNVGQLMFRLFEKNDVYFFWVDAFFCKKTKTDTLKNDIIQNGYEYKEKECTNMTLKEFQGHTEIKIETLEGEKVFIMPQKLDRSKEKYIESNWLDF